MRLGDARSRRTALRLILGSCAAAPFVPGALRPRSARAATAMAAVPFPNGASVLVAGNPDGPLDHWAGALIPALAHALPPGTRIGKRNAIGNDGVTGANQFTALAVPDGATALLVPGAAATAWLVGDPRVHFDMASWIPAMNALAPAALVGTVPLSAIAPEQSPRIAAAGPIGPDLPALLALDLLGANATPVFGLGEPDRARQALRDGAVDLVFLHGEDVPERARALAEVGAAPLFTFGTVNAAGQQTRDPLMPDVPTIEEVSASLLGRPLRGKLLGAWKAAAAATTLDYALVLPALTPPDIVGLWRSMSGAMAASPAVRALAEATSVRIETTPNANSGTVAIAANAATLLTLRGWLASRFGWDPT
jgi:hypothetical protein